MAPQISFWTVLSPALSTSWWEKNAFFVWAYDRWLRGMAWRKHWLSQLLWVCLQLNVCLLTLISFSVSGGVIRLDIAGHQSQAEMGLLWLEVTALGPCDIFSIDLQWNSFIFYKIEWSPTTGIDVAFAMVFWRVKLFPLTHPQPISLILASGHIPLGLPGMLISFVFFLIGIGHHNVLCPCLDPTPCYSISPKYSWIFAAHQESFHLCSSTSQKWSIFWRRVSLIPCPGKLVTLVPFTFWDSLR